MGNYLENVFSLSILVRMSKILYINQTLDEYRAALAVKGKLVDFFIERGTPIRSGNIYKGRVSKILPGIGAAFVDVGHEQAAYLRLNRASEPLVNKSMEGMPLREGGQVLVQIYREPVGMKGAKLTRNITLTGRYLVYRPFFEHIGVSRRIESLEERERLEEIVKELCPDEEGLIARTHAEGQSASIIKAEFNALIERWKIIQNNYTELINPGPCWEEISFVEQILRDIVDEEVEDIWVDTPELKAMVDQYVEKYALGLEEKCQLYRESTPIFKKFGIEREVNRGLGSKIYLRSGGVINIDQTEALVSIDVNTGRFVGKKNAEQTILKTNLEAVREIARQLRLRNCGGIIVIDLIDMKDVEHRKEVFQALNDVLGKDRARCEVMPLSRFGLVEMTRKQTKDTLSRMICEPCPYCDGSGRIKSVVSICYELLRDLASVLKKTDEEVSIHAHPDVVEEFCDKEGRGFMEALKESEKCSFVVKVDHHCHVEDYEIAVED